MIMSKCYFNFYIKRLKFDKMNKYLIRKIHLKFDIHNFHHYNYFYLQISIHIFDFWIDTYDAIFPKSFCFMILLPFISSESGKCNSIKPSNATNLRRVKLSLTSRLWIVCHSYNHFRKGRKYEYGNWYLKLWKWVFITIV